ncbi:type I-E CRISPR-associated protein Cas6/Cse3/CasE [Streptomyces niveus]|uniref:type I-E CRISPR-associated protein Cas6/Cse3/CasE n=1 Tax=Streptomyces niveus TaxID=193462 RepID=UPI003447DE15
MTATAHTSPHSPTSPSTPGPWLTRLRLNPFSRPVQRDLRNAAALHRRLMTLVPDGLGDNPRSKAGLLFRLDTDGTRGPVLLVQSRIPPDPTRLPQGYADVHAKDMNTLLDALRPGLAVRYRLLGNTVRRCGRNSTAGRWKQAIPLHGEEANAWWEERASASGLALHTVLSDSSDSLSTWHKDRQHATPAPIPSTGPGAADHRNEHSERNVLVPRQTTLFDGTATIRDAEALRSALLNGIGRSKSYGCGLLSLAPTGLDT